MAALLIAVPDVIRIRCRFCSKFRSPSEFVHGGESGYCWHCYGWHRKALEMLTTGDYPSGCQECDTDIAVLREQAVGEFKMYLHRKDGIYQVLCKACSDTYERKRLDLYGNTPYGHARKLKGAH